MSEAGGNADSTHNCAGPRFRIRVRLPDIQSCEPGASFVTCGDADFLCPAEYRICELGPGFAATETSREPAANSL